MKLWKQIVFVTLVIATNYQIPSGNSFEPIVGQLLSNDQASADFNLVLWRHSTSDANLPIMNILSEITIQPDGSFSAATDAKDFSLLLIPLKKTEVLPLIMYDFIDGVLVTKTVLSNKPQTNFSLSFQKQNNAISNFIISSYLNSYKNLLLNSETFTIESQGALIPLPQSTNYSKLWLQEVQAFNATSTRLQSYTRENTQRLNKSEFIVPAVRSFSLLEIPTYLQQVKMIQLNKDNFNQEAIDSIYTQMTQINWNILQTNRFLSNRMTSLILSFNSLIDHNISLSESIVAAKAAAELKAKQEAEKVAASAKAAATKKTTITCIKGNLTKKVTAVKPKCPAGYKKK